MVVLILFSCGVLLKLLLLSVSVKVLLVLVVNSFRLDRVLLFVVVVMLVFSVVVRLDVVLILSVERLKL